MNLQRVYEDSHRLILQWVREGHLDGLRVDHPDGLQDPEQYFQRIRQDLPDAWVVVEKILEVGEELPEDWPVSGTTGYDYLNRLAGLFVDPEGEGPISGFYASFIGASLDYPEMVREKKLYVLEELFGSATSTAWSTLLSEVCEHGRSAIATTPGATWPRHDEARSSPASPFIGPTSSPEQGNDRRGRTSSYVERGDPRGRPRRTAPEIDRRAARLPPRPPPRSKRSRASIESRFAMRFQQNTGPVMAKGVEDTTFYNFNRMVALNEVGGDPGRFRRFRSSQVS